LKAIVETGVPTVVILLNGRPLAIGEVADMASALLEGFYLGEEGGTALADILFGEVNPGGKLPISVPRNVGQLPDYYYMKPSAKRGYLYANSDPVYHFGYGLSYTTFTFERVNVTPTRVPSDGHVSVAVDITNTGKVTGDEVAQLYIHPRTASVTRPIRILRGFQRITLQPGERRTVTFNLGPTELMLSNRDMKRVVEPGTIEVFVGDSSEASLSATFEIMRPGEKEEIR
jgi:beta-glucosidase